MSRHTGTATEQMLRRTLDQRDAQIESLKLALKAETEALTAEKALADYLAEGVKDLYEHSQYLDRYRKARGL